MRKLVGLGVFIALAVFIHSCTKDVAQKPTAIDCNGVNADSNTYNITIKPILDNYCAYGGCHDAFTKESGVNLSDYSNVVSAFENKSALCTIKHESGCGVGMPYNDPKLADSLITYIECWANNGYAQ